MVKRLSISVALLSLAVFALGSAAVAYFQTDPATGTVSVSAGTPGLSIDVDQNCDGSSEGTIGDGDDFGSLDWDDPVPGHSTKDCFEIRNDGDGELDVYLKFVSFSGNSNLRAAVDFKVNSTDAPNSGWGPADSPAFTTANAGKGRFVGTVGEGASINEVVVRGRFEDDGTDQGDLAGKSFGFTGKVSGYTTGN